VIAADIIPASRRGEGIGYFGLGSTAAMALAPAAGVLLITDYGFTPMFLIAALASGLAILGTKLCTVPKFVPDEKKSAVNISLVDKLFEKGTGIPALLTMLFGISYGSINTFIAMLAHEAQIPDAGYFFIVGTLCVFISRPIGGRIFDSKGAAWIILPGAVLLFAALMVLIQTTTLTMLLSAAVLYGLGGGFLLPALMTWMLNLVRPSRRSGASATFYNMLDVGTSAGAIGLGAIAGDVGFINMYKYSAVAMVLFLILFILQWLLKPKKQAVVEVEENMD
jgi:predicted MFS family arabinose efflux permease